MVDDDDSEDLTQKTNVFRGDTLKVTNPDYKIPPCIVLLVGPDTQMGRQWHIKDAALNIGRNPDCEIHVGDNSLSKMHALIELKNDVCHITDLGATNTTVVNEQKLTPQKSHALKNNDQIKMGRLVFKFLQQGILTETQEKERMQSELEMARTVQESLLPSKPDARYDWIQIGGRYISATECGGDWWWHWACDNVAFVIIADATGHGAAAALITSAARSAVATLENKATVRIEEVYTTMSYAIHQCSGSRIAMSAFLVEIDMDTRKMRYINASHVPAILLPNDIDLEWNKLVYVSDPVSTNLGSGNQLCTVGELQPTEGTRLILLTDGITERVGNEGGALNERQFNKLVIASHIANLDSQRGFLDTLLRLSDQKAGPGALKDDITVVALDFV